MNPGAVQRTERLVRRTEVVDGWVVLKPPAHLATKLAALVDRPDSAPGDKDRHEIMALLGQGVSTPDAVGVVHDASARQPAEVTGLIDRAFEYIGDLRLDRNQRRTLNQLARDWRDHSLRLAHHTTTPSQPDRPGRGPPPPLTPGGVHRTRRTAPTPAPTDGNATSRPVGRSRASQPTGNHVADRPVEPQKPQDGSAAAILPP
jgi:hypothetical protein